MTEERLNKINNLVRDSRALNDLKDKLNQINFRAYPFELKQGSSTMVRIDEFADTCPIYMDREFQTELREILEGAIDQCISRIKSRANVLRMGFGEQ